MEPLPPPMPLDLVLEILARSDVTTILRYAATSKSSRRAVLGRRRLAHRAEANGGFDRALLLGCSYRFGEGLLRISKDVRVAQASRQHLRFDAGLWASFDAVASRDGLIVLLQRRIDFGSRESDELCVCNSLTGQTSTLPPADIHYTFPLPLLTVGDSGRSFRLLAVDWNLRTQTFSSKDGRWGDVVEGAHSVGNQRSGQPLLRDRSCASRALVLEANYNLIN